MANEQTAQAATAYFSRRSLPGGTTSTLRKVARMARIWSGARPYPMPRPKRGRYVLHPTKGWVIA